MQAVSCADWDAHFLLFYQKGDLRNQFYGSYNTYVNSEARSTCGSLIDENMVPPKGFRLFYDSNGTGTSRYPASMGVGDSPDALFDGAVYIQYQGWSFAHRVPVRMNPNRSPVHVHLMDVVKGSGKAHPRELEDFPLPERAVNAGDAAAGPDPADQQAGKAQKTGAVRLDQPLFSILPMLPAAH